MILGRGEIHACAKFKFKSRIPDNKSLALFIPDPRVYNLFGIRTDENIFEWALVVVSPQLDPILSFFNATGINQVPAHLRISPNFIEEIGASGYVQALISDTMHRTKAR